MRLTRRKRVRELTDGEKAGLRDARAARDEAHGMLADARARTPEIEAISGWLRRARSHNNFAARVELMLQQGRDEPPWP